MLFQRMNHLCLLLCVTGLFVGCGSDGPQVVPVKGVVSFKGTPMEKIAVVFSPENTGMIATGLTDAKGEFSLQTNKPGDGAMVGSYKVAFKYVPDEVPVMPGMEGAKKVVSPIPEKYGDASKSGKTATVDADKSKNNITFDLE